MQIHRRLSPGPLSTFHPLTVCSRWVSLAPPPPCRCRNARTLVVPSGKCHRSFCEHVCVPYPFGGTHLCRHESLPRLALVGSTALAFSCHGQHHDHATGPGATGTARIAIGGLAVVGNEQARAANHRQSHSDLLQAE